MRCLVRTWSGSARSGGARFRPVTLPVAAMAAGLAALSAAAADSVAQSGDAQDLAIAARAASKDLAEALKTQLVAGLKGGGAVSAIKVCNTAAPSIAAEVSAARGLEVRRTALKVRNPANAPDAFERKILEDFASKIAAGADPATLEHSETVTQDGVSTWRYMKAIPMAAEPCLACHGSQLQPDVKAAIAELYPNDAATGFAPGQLRGAFSLRKAN